MEVKIIEETRNELFKRREIKLDIKSDSSPSNKEVEKWVSENFETDVDTIKLKGIYGNFGSQNFSVSVNIYDSFEEKDRTEIKTKKQRDTEKKVLAERLKAEFEARKIEKESAEKQRQEKEKPQEETIEEIKEEVQE